MMNHKIALELLTMKLQKRLLILFYFFLVCLLYSGNIRASRVSRSYPLDSIPPLLPALNAEEPLGPSFTNTDDNLAFGFELFNQLIKQESIRNLIISPFLIEVSICMLYVGAEPALQQQLAKVLRRTPEEMEKLIQDNSIILKEFNQMDKSHHIHDVSSIWIKDSLGLNPDYAAKLEQLFLAKAEGVKIKDPAVVNKINDWINKQSDAKMPAVLSDVSNPDLLLINTLYFEGFWAYSFNFMGNLPYRMADGKERSHDMMYRDGGFEYFEDAYCQGARVPFYKSEFVFEVFLPKELAGISSIGDYLNTQSWNAWQAKFSPRKGSLILPQFKTAAKADMRDILYRMGLGLAMKENPNGLSAGIVKQGRIRSMKLINASVMVVDPSGSEALGSTGTGLKFDPNKKPFTMRVDHPFFFAVRHKKENKIILMGTIINPKKLATN